MRREMGIAAMVLLASLAADAVVVRKLPRVNVVENETISVDAQKATAVRSSNATVFSAALRESGEALISGARLGEANLDYVDDRGVFATRPVTVVPPYWDVLRRMFSEDPEISIDIVGDKVVIIGATANVDTIKRVEQAKAIDTSRIVAQVSYSTAQIGDLVRDFLARSGITNITVNVVGRDVCLSGKMYDTQSIEQLKKRVEGFVKDFPGMSVNTDELRIYKQKIMINIEFVQYNDTMSRNLGFRGPDSVTGTLGWKTQYDFKRNDSGTRSETFSTGGNVGIDGVQATINLLKQNGAAKTLYSTTLSTQSGIEVSFQNGGTIYMETSGGALSTGDLKEIDYGYIVKATPFIVDANTIDLDLGLDNKEDPGNIEGLHTYKIVRYQTKSKYLLRPNESIALSGFTRKKETEDKNGTPWLSNIPWVGEYLFGNTSTSAAMDEMMLVVTLNWAVEGEDDGSVARMDELRDRKVEVEMP